jgi:two-component system, chemotaxis family, protein-glutamate methylesterase/glutaminase
MSQQQFSVLIVDDSAAVRAAFSAIIKADPGLALFGTAGDPFQAADLMRTSLPDVILLDLELPKMDGLAFLKRIMSQRPLPVVVCSSHTDSGSISAMKALDHGAAEVLTKPRLDTPVARAEAAVRIGDALRAAIASRTRARKRVAVVPPGEKLTADVILPALAPRPVPPTDPIVAIGASTGGTGALQTILTALPGTAPPIAIVQHMPEHFTRAFAQRLDGLCRIEVREAVDGDVLHAGLALIAPGNHHMVLRRHGSQYRVGIVEGPYVGRHRPSVDVLFRSTAQTAGRNALGIILTGMGDDGAACMAELHAAGARTLAQDEASSVVYGMPREAVAAGGVDAVLPLDRFAAEIEAHGAHLRSAARSLR